MSSAEQGSYSFRQFDRAPSFLHGRCAKHTCRQAAWPASNSQQEDAELRAAGAVGIHHVKGLGIPRAHHPLESRPHVHELPFGAFIVDGQHAGAHGHGLHEREDVEVRLGADPADGVARLAAVAVHGPHGLLEQAAPVGRALALERYPDQPGRHLLDQGAGGRGQLQQQHRLRLGVLLHREVDVALAEAEERAGDAAPQGRRVGRARRQRQPLAGEGGHGDVEDGAHDGQKLPRLLLVHPDQHHLRAERAVGALQPVLKPLGSGSCSHGAFRLRFNQFPASKAW